MSPYFCNVVIAPKVTYLLLLCAFPVVYPNAVRPLESQGPIPKINHNTLSLFHCFVSSLNVEGKEGSVNSSNTNTKINLKTK